MKMGQRLNGHLRAIIPGVKFDESEVTLVAFDVYNSGDETVKWWYDEVEFIAKSGNAFDAEGEIYEGLGSAHDNLPKGWEPRPRISPDTAQRCMGEVVYPENQEIKQIRYEYSGDLWMFPVDESSIEELTMSYDDFLENEADGYVDWREVDFEKLREEELDKASEKNSTEEVGAPAGPIDEMRTPDVSFDDIGGLETQIQEIRETVQDPLVRPEVFETIGIDPPTGVLLHGPPGTGKTMLGKAVANESDASFFRIAGPELAQKYVGEGARIVRETFENARENQPAIIFIDELDAIATTRSSNSDDGQEGVYRTMMQLVAEMDGFSALGQVCVIGATNRIDRLDEAVLRPGRFDRIVEVPKPNEEGRKEIFRQYVSDMNVEDIDYAELGRRTEGLSGAHIKTICTEAGYMALRNNSTEVQHVDFLSAIQKVNSATKS